MTENDRGNENVLPMLNRLFHLDENRTTVVGANVIHYMTLWGCQREGGQALRCAINFADWTVKYCVRES